MLQRPLLPQSLPPCVLHAQLSCRSDPTACVVTAVSDAICPHGACYAEVPE